MKKIKTAIIGFGLSGSKFQAPFIETSEEFELCGIVVRQVEKVKEQLPNQQVYENIDQLFEHQPDVELVIISTPVFLHFDMAKKALLAGKNVVVEKPFVVTEQEGIVLLEIAKQQNVILSVYHNRRWDGEFLTVKELINSGKLGRIHSIEMNWDRYRNEVRSRWKEDNLPGSGLFYDVAPHMLDQAIQLFGFPKTVYGNMQMQREGAKTTDYFHVVLGYENASILIRGGNLVSAETPRFIVHGTKGSYMVYGMDPQEAQLVSGIAPTDESFAQQNDSRISILTYPDGTKENVPIQKGDYGMFFQQLSRAIRLGEEEPVSAINAIQVVGLLEAGVRSHNETKVITFN